MHGLFHWIASVLYMQPVAHAACVLVKHNGEARVVFANMAQHMFNIRRCSIGLLYAPRSTKNGDQELVVEDCKFNHQ